ncbi:hypothetical protein [Acinetobacter kyonggiensis]|uniref:Uncharacterized protein n=1 Tax=Acinetobacter kyonggiensis TaxID=595670 RepID=A0A1H3MBM5_9GAMM|nr:hypothetical protein [Acinetobacter kyonggiensis]SDY73996.1 hypothetical protein SAMN05421643_12522 [Acinetobacter kyonggiensis]
MTNIQSSEKIEIIDDLDGKEVEQEQQDKNNNTEITSGLDVFDLAELGSDLIDVLGDLVSGISLDL